MMLPRLYIARNLLRDDGVIFVSIDDHEVHNLRCLMNEIFGESSFVASCVWQKRYSRENRGIIGDAHDYLLCYAKYPEQFQKVRGLIQPTEEQLSVYKDHGHPRGRWRGIPMTAQGHRKNQMYPIKTPSGVVHRPPEGRCWSMTEPEFQKLRDQGRIYFGKNDDSQPSVIRFLDEIEGYVPWTWWPAKEVGHTDEARKEIRRALGTQTAFDTPKPVRLIQRVLEIASPRGDAGIVVDFFGGSGTTLEAVLRQNAEDRGNRRCILVQMAEPLDADHAEFSDIAQVARTRIRRALDDLRDSDEEAPGIADDEGFRAFQLVPSNFPQWRPRTFGSGEELAEQIRMFMDSSTTDAEPEAIAHELLLKTGYALTTKIERVPLGDSAIHLVDGGALALLLEPFSIDMIRPLIEMQPSRVIALDHAFGGSDEVKKNLALQCRDAGIGFESV